MNASICAFLRAGKKRLVLLLGFALGGLLLAGCTPTSDAPVVGVWERTASFPQAGIGERLLTFNDDYTFIFRSGNSGRWADAQGGFYKTKDGAARELYFYQNTPNMLYCLGESATAQPVIGALSQGYTLPILRAKNEVPFLVEYTRSVDF